MSGTEKDIRGSSDRSRYSLKGRSAERLAIGILVLLPFVVYLPVTIGYATFAGFDHTGINQPLKQEAFSSIRSGELPLWEPGLDRGMPLFAEGEAGIFYPLNLLFLLPGDFLTIYNFVLLLCIVTAGLLFYLWIRRLGVGPLAGFISAVTFQWGSTVNFSKANLNIMEGFILAPLMMLLLEPTAYEEKSRGRLWLRTAGIAGVFAAMIFAGQAQYVIYTGLFALVYIVLRIIFSGRAGWKSTMVSMGVPFVVGAIIGAGLSAVQLFSTLELIPLSERGVGSIEGEFAVRGLWLSMERLYAVYIFPAYHVSLDHFLPYLSTTVYVGPIVVLMAGYAIRSRKNINTPVLFPLFITGLIFLYLAMGANAPIAGELTSWGPLAHFRGHGRLGGYFGMAMIVLMGMGLDAFLKKQYAECDRRQGIHRFIPPYVVELLIMAVLAIPFITKRVEYVETRTAVGLLIGFILLFFAGCLVGHLIRSRIPVVVAIVLTLAMQIIGFQATSSETILTRSTWDTDRADLIYIRDHSESDGDETMFAIRTQASVRLHERILQRGLGALEGGSHAHIDHLGSADAGLMENLVVCNADLPLELSRWEWLVHRNLWPSIESTQGLLSDENLNLLGVLGVNWIVTENGNLEFPVILEEGEWEISQYEKLTDPDWQNRDIPYYIYQRESIVRPYAVFWHWTEPTGGVSEEIIREEFFEYLKSPDVTRTVFIEGLVESEETEENAGGAYQSMVSNGKWRSRTEYSVRVTLSHDAIFMFRDAWYPGWEVFVYGEKVDLLKADLVFKAVKLNAGRNEVSFKYSPRFLMAGWIVSGISLLVILGLVFLPRVIYRESESVPESDA